MSKKIKNGKTQTQIDAKKKEQWLITGVIVGGGILLAAIVALFIYFNQPAPPIETLADSTIYTASTEKTDYVKLNVSYTADNGQRYIGDIVIALDAEQAPVTVANFQKLVGEGFYDGLIFHRVIENFMIQGGDPEGTGFGGSDENIVGEFANNGIENNILHERGVISMARNDQSMDSASSQFFIMHQTTPQLDGDYAAFGRVVFGMETVDGIAAVNTNSNDKPLREAKINSASFVTYNEAN